MSGVVILAGGIETESVVAIEEVKRLMAQTTVDPGGIRLLVPCGCEISDFSFLVDICAKSFGYDERADPFCDLGGQAQ